MSQNQGVKILAMGIQQKFSQFQKDRGRILNQLKQFRQNPTIIQSHLINRIARYKSFENTQYLLSKNHKKKAIQVHQKQPSKKRIGELIGFILGEKGGKLNSQKLVEVSKLNQIASKLCQTICPQMREQLKFKPETSRILRQILQQDPVHEYPNSVTCLVSLGFDQPFEDIMNLLIDDGVPTRSNRLALLNPHFKYVGLATMKQINQASLRCTVIVLTEKIIQRVHNTAFVSKIPEGPAIINSSPQDNIKSYPSLLKASSNNSNVQIANKEQGHNSELHDSRLIQNLALNQNIPNSKIPSFGPIYQNQSADFGQPVMAGRVSEASITPSAIQIPKNIKIQSRKNAQTLSQNNPIVNAQVRASQPVSSNKIQSQPGMQPSLLQRNISLQSNLSPIFPLDRNSINSINKTPSAATDRTVLQNSVQFRQVPAVQTSHNHNYYPFSHHKQFIDSQSMPSFNKQTGQKIKVQFKANNETLNDSLNPNQMLNESVKPLQQAK